MNRILAILILFCVTGTCSAELGAVALLGHFSNQKISQDADPHFLSGYKVSLYQIDRTVFGNIAIAVGSPEPVKGRLYDIKFDPTTKGLSFKAKYSEGREYNKQTAAEGRESRVLLAFSGKITPKGLAGTVILQDGYSLDQAGKKTFAAMKRTRSKFKPDSFTEWSSYPYPVVNW